MKVGIAQIDCAVGDWKANLETIAAEAGRAAEAGCEVMLVPEMADTGYDMAALRTHASDWDGGPCARLVGGADHAPSHPAGRGAAHCD